MTKETTQEKQYQIYFNCDTPSESKIVSYNGNLDDYYMVDYFDKDECRWVRVPFQTLQDVYNIMTNIQLEKKSVKNFNMYPEKWLSQLRNTTWNEETNEYEKDTITNRVDKYGTRYELISLGITGETQMDRNEVLGVYGSTGYFVGQKND
jgi:hypothetical protein